MTICKSLSQTHHIILYLLWIIDFEFSYLCAHECMHLLCMASKREPHSMDINKCKICEKLEPQTNLFSIKCQYKLHKCIRNWTIVVVDSLFSCYSFSIQNHLSAFQFCTMMILEHAGGTLTVIEWAQLCRARCSLMAGWSCAELRMDGVNITNSIRPKLTNSSWYYI